MGLKKALFVVAILFFSGCSFLQEKCPGVIPDSWEDIEDVEEYLPDRPLTAAPGPTPVIDHLGLAKYQDTFVRFHPNGFGVGVFTQKDLFGDPYNALDKRLTKGGVPLVRYNLRWSDSHTFYRSDFPRIVREARRFVPLVNKYPDVGCYFSGATEHKLGVNDATDLANAVLEVIPERCIYVNNPWVGNGSFIKPGPRIINEVHGDGAQPPRIGGPFSFSFDGSDAFDVNVTALKTRMRNAEFFAYWTSQNNGRRNAADTTPRPERKFWPTGRLIRALAFLHTEQGDVRLPARHLVKPKSDQHSVPPASRELKPVFIFPVNAERIQLKVGNRVVATSEVAMSFADGRKRYYFPEFGYAIVKAAGTNVLDVYVKGRKIGTANPGFRQGSYR